MLVLALMSLGWISDCTRAVVICVLVPDILVLERRRFGSGCMFASCTLLGLLLSDGVVVLDCLTMLSTALFGHAVEFFLLMGLIGSLSKASDCRAQLIVLNLLLSSPDVLRNISLRSWTGVTQCKSLALILIRIFDCCELSLQSWL